MSAKDLFRLARRGPPVRAELRGLAPRMAAALSELGCRFTHTARKPEAVDGGNCRA